MEAKLVIVSDAAKSVNYLQKVLHNISHPWRHGLESGKCRRRQMSGVTGVTGIARVPPHMCVVKAIGYMVHESHFIF